MTVVATRPPAPPVVVPTPSFASLEDLATAANERHADVLLAGMTMLYAGLEAGSALLEAKQRVPRGQWLPWCAANLEFGQSSACSYMLVARHRDRLLAEADVTTMQKALAYLREHKLTTQTRIDDERIAEIRRVAAECGVTRAARRLGESFGTVHRYANGPDKLTTEERRARALKRRGRAPTHANIAITDPMIESMAVWLHDHFAPKPRRGVNDFWRGLAVEALGAALRDGEGP